MNKIFLSAIALFALAACTQQPKNAVDTDASANAKNEVGVKDETETAADAETEMTYKSKLLTNQGEEYERMKNNSWKVNGGVGARNFANALYMGTDNYTKYPEDAKEALADKEFFDCDEKNGYAHHFEEGAGGWTYDCCYWKGADGKITVALYNHSHDCFSETEYDCCSYLLFFNYNASTHMLEPIEQPFQLEVANPNHMKCTLPRKGKDIVLNLSDEQTCMPNGRDYYLLKWNGKSFDVSKTEAPTEE